MILEMGRKQPRRVEVGEVIIEKADNIVEKRHEFMRVGSEEGVLGKRIVVSPGDGESQGFQPGGA